MKKCKTSPVEKQEAPHGYRPQSGPEAILREHNGTSGLAAVAVAFNGMWVTAYNFRGRICWIAQEVGRGIGYTREGFLAAFAGWSSELIQGKDFDVLRGDELREFKGLLDAEAKVTSARISQLTILYEPGFYLVCFRTHLALGVKLRRVMADDVMPKLARGEPILPQGRLLEAELAEARAQVAQLKAALDAARSIYIPAENLAKLKEWIKKTVDFMVQHGLKKTPGGARLDAMRAFKRLHSGPLDTIRGSDAYSVIDTAKTYYAERVKEASRLALPQSTELVAREEMRQRKAAERKQRRELKDAAERAQTNLIYEAERSAAMSSTKTVQ